MFKTTLIALSLITSIAAADFETINICSEFRADGLTGPVPAEVQELRAEASDNIKEMSNAQALALLKVFGQESIEFRAKTDALYFVSTGVFNLESAERILAATEIAQ